MPPFAATDTLPQSPALGPLWQTGKVQTHLLPRPPVPIPEEDPPKEDPYNDDPFPDDLPSEDPQSDDPPQDFPDQMGLSAIIADQPPDLRCP